jgi:dipeptidyl-peptidase-3
VLSSFSSTLDDTDTANMTASIDSATLQQYLADSPPSVVPLAIKPHFEALNDQQKLYAHHISK